MTDPDLRDPNLDRAYRETPRDEPSPELDERIRAAARRAVGTGPQSLDTQAAAERRRSWTSRWRVPLSVAATLVLAATLTVMVQEEERRPRDDAGRTVAPAAPRQAERQTVPPASARDADAGVRALKSAPAPAAAPPRPAAAPTAPAAPPTAQPETAAQQKLEERARPVEAPAATEARPEPLEMRRQTAVPAAPPPLASPAPVPPVPAAKTAPQSAPAGVAPDGLLRRDRALGDRPERTSREASTNAIRSPEAWVEHIRTLRAQGRDAEATIELTELRRTYPDFRLPADLAR